MWTENILKTELFLSFDFIAQVFLDHKSNMAHDEIIFFFGVHDIKFNRMCGIKYRNL